MLNKDWTKFCFQVAVEFCEDAAYNGLLYVESRFCPNFLVGDSGSVCWCQAQFNLKSVSDPNKLLFSHHNKQNKHRQRGPKILYLCRLFHIRRRGWGGAQRLQAGWAGVRSRGQGAPVLHQVASHNLLRVNLLSKSAVFKYLLSKSAVVKYLLCKSAVVKYLLSKSAVVTYLLEWQSVHTGACLSLVRTSWGCVSSTKTRGWWESTLQVLFFSRAGQHSACKQNFHAFCWLQETRRGSIQRMTTCLSQVPTRYFSTHPQGYAIQIHFELPQDIVLPDMKIGPPRYLLKQRSWEWTGLFMPER